MSSNAIGSNAIILADIYCQTCRIEGIIGEWKFVVPNCVIFGGVANGSIPRAE